MFLLLKRVVMFIFVPAFILYHYFFYVDLSAGCRIKIGLSLFEWNNITVKQAIKALSRASPKDYQDLCANVHTINPNLSCGGFGGGCYYPPQETIKSDGYTIYVSTAHGDLAWTIGVIVHETCHAKQYHSGRILDEQECYSEDNRILLDVVQIPPAEQL